MIKFLCQSLGLFALLVSPLISYAEQSATEQLNAFVTEVTVFQAKFEQTVLDSSGALVEQAEGDFMLSRPGKFRWNYDSPYPQQIVADGQRIWFYDEDLEQITVQSQDETLLDTPAGLLSGRTLPEAEYTLTNLNSNDGLAWVELTPKQEEANYQSIRLAFNATGLQQMVMVDAFDQHTRLRFSEVKINPILADDIFIFTPPDGVDVVGE